jgi:hypothetical protein
MAKAVAASISRSRYCSFSTVNEEDRAPFELARRLVFFADGIAAVAPNAETIT